VRILDHGPVGAIRRNHALEHATIHVLTERSPGVRLVGRSDWGGFNLYGSLETALVEEAVAVALARLKGGDNTLAVHPQCGTNLATGAILAWLASSAALSGRWRSRLAKSLQLVAGVGAAFVLARPLGARVQRDVTTDGDVSQLEVSRVLRLQRGAVILHRVVTNQGHA
jgi:hypothetical protein